MTTLDINSTEPRRQYTAGAGQKGFTYPFEIFNDSDLAVYKDAVLQTLNTDYTVSGAGTEGGGDVEFVSAMAGGEIITILRALPYERDSLYTTSGPFKASNVERDFDTLVAMMQQVDRDLGFSIRAATTDENDSGDFLLPTARGDKVLAFDSNGAISLQPIAYGLSSTYPSVDDYTALRAVLVPSDGDTVVVTDSLTGGIFQFDSAEATADDGGIYIDPTDGTTGAWVRKFTGPVYATWYGAVGDGSTDDTAAIQAAVDYCDSQGGGAVYIPPTTNYYKTLTPIFLKDNVQVFGSGKASKIWNEAPSTANGEGLVFVFGTYDGGGFSDATEVTFYACNDVTKGDDQVTTTTAADAGNFAAGDVVYVWSSDGYTSGAGLLKPSYQQITEVVSVDAGTGAVELRDPIYKTRTGSVMRISKGGDSTGHTGNNYTPQMVKYAAVYNLCVQSTLDAWSRYGGCYRCYVGNLWIDGGNNVFATNGWAHGIIENIQATIDVRTVELAYFCHDTIVRNVVATLENAATTTAALGVVTFAEGAHDNTVSGVHADYRGGAANAQAFKFGQGSARNKVSDCTVRATLLDRVVSFSHAYPTTMEYGQNLVSECVVDADTISSYAFSFTADAATDDIGCLIQGGSYKVDTALTTGFLQIAASSIQLDGVDFGGIVDGSTNTLDATSDEIILSGCILPVDFPLADLQTGLVNRAGNHIVGRSSVENSDMTYNQGSDITATIADLVTRTLKANEPEAEDAWDFEICAFTTGADAHEIQIQLGGTNLYAFTSTTAGVYNIRGSIVLLTGAGAWRTYASENVAGTLASYRNVQTVTITSDRSLAFRAGVAAPTSAIKIEHFSIRPKKRY